MIQRSHLGDWDLFESESVHYSLQHCWVLLRLLAQLSLLHGAETEQPTVLHMVLHAAVQIYSVVDII